MNFFTPTIVEYLNKRGIWVVYWVLNDPKDFEKAY